MNANFVLPRPLTPVDAVEAFDGPLFFDTPVSSPAEADAGGWVEVEGHGRCLMMSSYSYLGLLGHPSINQATQAATETYGTGVHGSRLVTGTLPVHKQLERALAAFFGRQDAILFSSGYVANLATISALVGPGDSVFCDVLSHASIRDGCRISGADVVFFAHNDMRDLGRKLARRKAGGNTLVVTDAVFSMEGDIADLPGLVEAAKSSGALLMVDEAHSLGVIGARGRGLEEHFGLPPDTIDVKMGTLSKTIPSIGGYVVADSSVIRLLKNRARGYIFSSSMTGPAAAAALAALRLIDEEPWRVNRLQRNASIFRQMLADHGVRTGASRTAIVPAICGESALAMAISSECLAQKIVALPITAPAVQEHAARLRLTPGSDHSETDLQFVADVVSGSLRKAGVGK